VATILVHEVPYNRQYYAVDISMMTALTCQTFRDFSLVPEKGFSRTCCSFTFYTIAFGNSVAWTI